MAKSKIARTRGPDVDHPVNRGGPKGVAKTKRTLGRPTEFMPARICQARAMSAAGATVDEIAEAFEVSKQTLYTWGNKFPDFLDAIKVGKDTSDDRVVSTLYQRALAGENTAMIFWLKNRRPQEWRDKQEIDISGGMTIEHREDERSLALSMIQLLRTAGQDDEESEPVTIEHQPEQPTAAPQEPQRARRSFSLDD